MKNVGVSKETYSKSRDQSRATKTRCAGRTLGSPDLDYLITIMHHRKLSSFLWLLGIQCFCPERK